MNEAQRQELQQIRDQQNWLADKLARLESRLRLIEDGAADESVTPPVAAVTMPLPPPMPPPAVPSVIPPPMPREAFAFQPEPVPPPVSLPATAGVPPPAAAPKESLEVRIGTTWLVRVGVVMMLTALAFLGSYLYKNVVPHLGPGAKVGLLYLGAAALAGAGASLERGKEAARSPRMLNFARIVLAGGLAAVYYVTYAAHWNPGLLVLRNPLLDGALLVGWTAFMVWLADRRGSEVLATFAVLLAYYASAVNEIAAFTLFSNLSLTVAAVFLLRRHLWRVFPYASLLATFGSYAFWRFYHGLEPWTYPGQVALPSDRFWIESIFLAIYWFLFTGSVFMPGAAVWTPRRRAGFASLNNGAFFVLTTWLLHSRYPGDFWEWSLGFGVTLCVLSETCRLVRPRVDSETEGAYLVQGLVLVTLGFFTYLSGWQLSLVLAAQSVVLLGRARVRNERLPLWVSLVSAGAACAVAANRFVDGWTAASWPSAAGTGALLVFNAWWSQRGVEKANATTAARVDSKAEATPDYYSALGVAIWFGLIESTFARMPALVPALAAAAVALTASVYLLRVRAIPFYAQGFLLAAYIHRLSDDDLLGWSRAVAPWWSMAALLAATLLLGHWWQRRWPWIEEARKPASGWSRIFAAADAVCVVLLLHDWLRPGVSAMPVEAWVAANAALSLALLIYGMWTRYRALAVAGQGLLLVSVVGCVLRVWSESWDGPFGSEMVLTLVPLVVLLATIFAIRRSDSGRRGAAVSGVYEAVATLLMLGWGWRYVPAEMRFAFFGVAGAAVSVWAQVKLEARWLWWSAALTTTGAVALMILPRDDRAGYLHLIGIAAIAGQQQVARFHTKREPVTASAAPPRWQAALIIAATLCAWVVLNARVSLSFDRAFTLATAWSLFAAVVFAVGLGLHEKVYRWLGLTILVCTLGRIAVVDIWQLDSLGRALSALCLGLVLLGIGYLYNRFHARWHGLF